MRFFLSACLAFMLAQAGTYSISGRVTFDNNRPFAGAEITATTDGWDPVVDPVLSDDQGRFTIKGLPEGTFILSANRDDVGSFFYGQTPEPGMVSDVTVNDRTPHKDVSFVVSRPATITGIVRSLSGAVMPNMQISAARRVWSNGKSVLQPVSNAFTDDLGRFRLPRLTRGRYLVCASMQQAQPVLPVGLARFGEKSSAALAESCYPERFKPLLKLDPGQSADVELVLAPIHSVEISGRVLNSDGIDSVSVTLSSDQPAVASHSFGAQADPNTHTFHIENVVAGHYHLFARAYKNGEQNSVQPSAAATLDVTDTSQTIDLILTEPLQVTATIQAPTHTENITVALRPADDPGAQIYFAVPGEVKTIPIPYPGRYWLITRAPTHCPAIARVGRLGVDAEKLDAKDHAIELSAGVQYTLDVTFTSDCGTIEGKVVDAAGKVVLKSRQLILLSGTPEDPGDLLTNSSREDGSFDFKGIAPGKYIMWSWSEADEWDGVVPNLHDIAGQGTAIKVVTNHTVTINLPLIRRVE